MSLRQLKISQSITVRDSDSLQRYLSEVSRTKILSSEEEVALAIRIKNGDRNAANELVKANLRFVVSVAKQYQGHGIPLLDLVSEGNIGLYSAALRYDPTRGFKFITYAVWWIRQHIMHSIGVDSRLIRLPVNRVVMTGRLQREKSMLEQSLEREPTPGEIAGELGVTEAEIEQLLQLNQPGVSLDAPVGDDDSQMIDHIPNPNASLPERRLQYESLKAELRRSLHILSQKQQFIIIHFYGIGGEQAMTLDQLGEHLNVTKERIRQIKDKALTRLQKAGNASALRSFLG